MRRNGAVSLPCGLGQICLAIGIGNLWLAMAASAQNMPENAAYSRKNTFGILAAYSNDSSHMLLGTAENRKLLDFGGTYGRRLLMNDSVNWQYSAEFLPIALESDPLGMAVIVQTEPTRSTMAENEGAVLGCAPQTIPFKYQDINGVTHSGFTKVSCYGRQWTVGEAMSPLGLRWNFRPTHKLQPFLIGHGGYMYTTRPIPLAYAGSFNFTVDIGAGFELYRTRTRSISAEYRYHHISNGYTANTNPGIDSGVVQVTYAFGR